MSNNNIDFEQVKRLAEAERAGAQARLDHVPSWRQYLWYRSALLLLNASERVARVRTRLLQWSRACMLKANGW